VAPSARSALFRPRASLFGTDQIGLATGVWITPDAAPGSHLIELDPHLAVAPAYRAGGAAAIATSPDGATLVVLTSGYNAVFDPATGKRLEAASSEWLFVYDVTTGEARERQVLPVPNAMGGVAFAPGGDVLYVGGGSDDVLRVFRRDPAGAWAEVLPAVKLGHRDARGRGGLGDTSPYAAGVAVSASGARVVVANHGNDSVTVFDAARGVVEAEVPLFPGGGVAGGEYPAHVVVVGEARAFVTCQRDREVVEVDLATRKVARRIQVGGQPVKLVASRDGARLYVANANGDSVSVVDVAGGRVIAELPTAAPDGAATALRGSNPNALALSPDESRLYVTNGGNNDVAVIDLASRRVVGLVPTGFYPTSVAVSKDGAHLFVAHAKSASGPNPVGPWSSPRNREDPYGPGAGNQYALQLEHAGLLSLPVPDAPVLAKLTAQSLANNRFDADPAARVPPVFAALRAAGAVKHVIYVIGENRTYDQILGDLRGADGDPRLALWPEAITPNHHALARAFVTLDRFFDAGGVSGEGWEWSTSGRTTDVDEKEVPIEYASRGKHSYDWEGANRGVNVSLPTLAERRAWNPATPDSIDLVPGTADVGAVDGPDEGGTGFLWDAAVAKGLAVRNYGAFCDESTYSGRDGKPPVTPPLTDPRAAKMRVAFPTKRALHERTDPYFRGFDMRFADYWRVQEWARELDEYAAKGTLPALEIVRLPHDHLGSFDDALDGVDTPDTQMADHDYALGLLVEKVSRSPFWKDTVIVVLEDDAQNGSDHVDAHRSFALFAGGHVKRGGAVVSTPYATPSVLRTIELLLGLDPLGQADGFAPPMAEAFDAREDATPFVVQVPPVLRSTRLPLAAKPGAQATKPRGDAATWARLMKGQDFSREDALDAERFNAALACGLGVVRCVD
jgi:YVTN family beta-propeller protein